MAPRRPASAPDPAADPRPCVAYLMSRFPRLTETFVLDEILALEARGVRVEVLPLWRESAPLLHPEARAVVERAHFTPHVDGTILWHNLWMLLRRPRRYLGTLLTLLRANRGSLRYLAGALAIFPKAVSFARRIPALGATHVHAHFASHPAAAAFVVGRLADLPWSFTAHGSDLHREQAMLAEKVAEARFVVVISEYNRRFVLDHVGAAAAPKLRVIHCGVDPDRFAPRAARASADASPGRSLCELVCVGTLHAVKGQGVLLEACAELARRGVVFRCHLVGDGPDRAALEARARRLGIADRVRFHGARDRDGVRDALAAADVAVAPSVPTRDGRREGIPVVLMEAGASGLPLVASRLSGIPEIVREGETGRLVEPGDVAGLAAALEALARDPAERRRLGAGARAAVERDFRLAHNAGRLQDAFFGSRDLPSRARGEGAAPGRVPAAATRDAASGSAS